MLKFKKDYHTQDFKNAYNDCLLTEVAFYIGTEKIKNNIINKKLVNNCILFIC